MALRDQLLPVVDSLRKFEAIFGTRRFSVTITRRVWSGSQSGEGTATDSTIPIIPKPRVRDVSHRDTTLTEAELAAFNTGKVTGQVYMIGSITPQYTTTQMVNGVTTTVTGGYLAEQLRLWPNRDTGFVENLVQLVGDDGYLRECAQIDFFQDRMFNYKMLVKEIDRPRTFLTGIAITPSAPSVVHGNTQQLVSTGTFSGGGTSILTSLSAWSSSNTGVATVDIYGNLTAVAAGSATITATCLGQTTTTSVTVI